MSHGSRPLERGSESRLVIDNVTYEYQGEYECKATSYINGQERVAISDPVSLQVVGKFLSALPCAVAIKTAVSQNMRRQHGQHALESRAALPKVLLRRLPKKGCGHKSPCFRFFRCQFRPDQNENSSVMETTREGASATGKKEAYFAWGYSFETGSRATNAHLKQLTKLH